VSDRTDPIVVVAYDPGWPGTFRTLGRQIRTALGATARRVDHVGSTAVPGLDAKPAIDIQVSVTELEPSGAFVRPLEGLGLEFIADNPDRSKRFFRARPGIPAAHVHVRPWGSFDEQLNLLFRDYLRTHRDAAEEYAAVKRELALRFRDDRPGYVRAKESTVWSILRRAHDWAQESAWAPGSSDA